MRGVSSTTLLQDKLTNTERCYQIAETLTWSALWKFLLVQKNETLNNASIVIERYLRRRGVPHVRQGFLNTIDKQYQSRENHFFHPNYSIMNAIVLPTGAGAFEKIDTEIRSKKNAEAHVCTLIDKWRKQLPPGALLSTIKELLKFAQSLKKDYPEQVDWLLSSERQYTLPKDSSVEKAEGYRCLAKFLEQSALLEEVLLEFTTFTLMLENRGPFNEVDERIDYFIYEKQFPLSQRLSKIFYKHYTGFRQCKYSHHHALLVKNSVLLNYVCGEDDDLLLELLENLWNEMPDILVENPSLYERMRLLWIKLCESSDSNHVINVFRDANIYTKISSEDLFAILELHPDDFEQILYGKSNPITSDKVMPLSELQNRNIKKAKEILMCLTLNHLCKLKPIFKFTDSIIKLINLAIVEKLKIIKTEEFDDLKNEFLLDFFKEQPKIIPEILEANNQLCEHIQPEVWMDLCKANKNITDAWNQPRSYLGFVLTNEKIYKKFRTQQLIELMSSLSAVYQLKNDQFHLIRQRLQLKLKKFITSKRLESFKTSNELIEFMSKLADFCPLTIEQNRLIYEALKEKLKNQEKEKLKYLYKIIFQKNYVYESLKLPLKTHHPWVLTTVKQAYNHRFRPFVFYSSRIKEKWLAIPFGWQVGFCAFLALTGAAMVSAGVVSLVLCPPLLVVLPILGKMALPLLVGAAASILAAIAGILHLIHIAITPAPRPVPSNAPSTKSERQIKKQAKPSTQTVNKKNKKLHSNELYSDDTQQVAQNDNQSSESDSDIGAGVGIFSKGQRHRHSPPLEESNNSGDEYRI